MNSKEIQTLTRKLAANPNFLREVEEETMHDLLLDYTARLLDPDVEQEVRELIASDPVAAAMWKSFNEIDARLRSPEGRQWTEEADERILSNLLRKVPGEGKTQTTRVAAQPLSSPAFFDRLSKWMAEWFPKLSLQAAYSVGKADEVIKTFPSISGDLYEAQLVRDSLGRWFLRIFTKDVEAAKRKLSLKIEPESREMKFIAVEPAMFFAEVRLSESMAEALKSETHRPVFLANE